MVGQIGDYTLGFLEVFLIQLYIVAWNLMYTDSLISCIRINIF